MQSLQIFVVVVLVASSCVVDARRRSPPEPEPNPPVITKCPKWVQCENDGTCVRTQTPGWGQFWSDCQKDETCVKSQTRVGGGWEKFWRCQCLAGFIGERCEIKDYCVGDPCQNGGKCTSETSTFRCECPMEYMGKTCEEKSHCADAPCKNGGICENGPTTYSCRCVNKKFQPVKSCPVSGA